MADDLKTTAAEQVEYEVRGGNVTQPETADAAAFLFIRDMRCRLGVDPHETCRDSKIMAMTPMQRLRLLCGWHFGDPSWAPTIIEWVKDAGFKIND